MKKTKPLTILIIIIIAQSLLMCTLGASIKESEQEIAQASAIIEELEYENSNVQKELLMTKQQKETLTREKAQAEEEAARLKQEEQLRSQEALRIAEENKKETIWEYTTSTDITQPCGLSADELNRALVNTGLKGLGQKYLDAEMNHGVNAVVLIAIHAHESGWGNSSLSQSNNNLGGIKTKSGGWASFSSKGECISYSAKLLGENYLTPQGKFYNGTDLTSVNIKYCETSDWAGKVVDTINTILKRIKG